MEITNPHINNYLYRVTPPRDRILQEMEVLAKKHNFPIIGPLVGRFLFQMARITKAQKIFELGSGYGYSAYWFASAMGKKGKIICTDGDEKNKILAESFFKRAKISNKITFKVGNALEILAATKGTFDIILNDVDKHQYPEVFDLVIPKLKRGGVFITDNLLWSGQVLDPHPDASTLGILKFTHKIYSSKNVFSTIMPIRDGISISVKL